MPELLQALSTSKLLEIPDPSQCLLQEALTRCPLLIRCGTLEFRLKATTLTVQQHQKEGVESILALHRNGINPFRGEEGVYVQDLKTFVFSPFPMNEHLRRDPEILYLMPEITLAGGKPLTLRILLDEVNPLSRGGTKYLQESFLHKVQAYEIVTAELNLDHSPTPEDQNIPSLAVLTYERRGNNELSLTTQSNISDIIKGELLQWRNKINRLAA